jgi:hypothetical protein
VTHSTACFVLEVIACFIPLAPGADEETGLDAR